MDILLKKLPSGGWTPQVIDAKGKTIWTGVAEPSPAFALSQAIGYINTLDPDE